MTRFAIVIPFRPQSQSVYWEKENKLLHQTVTTALRQTYNGIKIFVVYTDRPTELIEDERVQYVPFPFGYQSYEEILAHEDLLEKFKTEKMVVRRWDKARKINWGCKLAKEQGFDYIMALDADDLLSKKLFSLLAAEAEGRTVPGWYMHKGFIYKPGTRFFMLVPKFMRFLNGSTHVLRADLITIPDFTSTNWLDYSLFTDHGWVKDRLKEYCHVDLLPIKNPMLVYVVHGSNISQVYQKEFGKTFKNFVKLILRGRILTKSKREEFNIEK